jgi:TolA-binding protein
MTDDRLYELGKQLPWDRPDAERREAVRSALLVAATQGDRTSGQRWVLVGGGFAAGALAAAAIAIVFSGTQPAAAPRQAHARVDAPATAQLEHTVTATRGGTHEIVRVRAGTVRVAVPAMSSGDRVRTKTADAEVEGNGAYEVVVQADALARVTVTAGTARITTDIDGAQQTVFLSEGQTWRATIYTAALDLPAPEAAKTESAPAVAEPAPVVEPAASTAPSPIQEPPVAPAPRAPTARTSTAAPETPAVATTAQPGRENAASSDEPRLPAVTALTPEPKPAPPPSATERRFQAGYALLREGKHQQAAVELGAAADAGGDDPLAADARYFQAIALVRSGQKAEAERVLLAFLDHAKQSLRRGRAAMLLGRLVADRGDTASAVSWFKSALGDPDPSIAAAAQQSIDALAPR